MSTKRAQSDNGTDSPDTRDRRALEECMTVLPQGGDVFEVVSQSGASYQVDTRVGRCTCADHEHREVRCKHIRRARFADGQRPIPPAIDMADVDDQLGEHTDGDVYQLLPDGGRERPEDCVCGEFINAEIPCWPCYHAGFETIAEGVLPDGAGGRAIEPAADPRPFYDDANYDDNFGLGDRR